MSEQRPDPEAEFWTTTDVAAYLGVQVGTVSSYRGRGQMPEPDEPEGRTHRWKPARIIAWHEQRLRPGVGGRPEKDYERQQALADLIALRDRVLRQTWSDPAARRAYLDGVSKTIEALERFEG